MFTLGKDYATEISVSTFIGKGRDYKGDDLVPLRNKRVVFASEPEDGVVLNVSLLKRIVGRDWVHCRPLHSNRWIDFQPTFKVAILTNPEIGIYDTADP